MEITKSGEAPNLVVAIAGRLDTSTAPQLEEALGSSLDGITALTFDLSALDYISSAGLRVLLSVQKTMNRKGSMIVTKVQEPVMDVFEVTGFTDVLTIKD